MTLQFETTPLLNRGNSMGSRPGSVMTAGPPMKKYGKLVLVDLAGSERLEVCLHMQQNPSSNNHHNNKNNNNNNNENGYQLMMS